MTNVNNTIQQGLSGAERVFEVLHTVPEIQDRKDAIALPKISKAIALEHVSFGYDKELVLKDINLKIRAGELVAFVGMSGGGKTTLVNLIPRFYDVTAGRILIDGVDIRDVKIASLRSQIGVVTQQTILFNDTVRKNIAYGDIQKSEEDIVNAAKAANAHDFIARLPEGYETIIGEQGVKLSGGERQRISIARALLKDAPILILDEATSSLDTEAEIEVQDALDQLMKRRTTLVIAHRLSTIRNADRIIALVDGSIVEEGTHEALLEKQGEYYKLYTLQFKNGAPPPNGKQVTEHVQTEDLLIRIWNDRRADHCNPLLFFLFLLSLVYGSLMGFRSLLYRFGLLRARRLPCPVVSVGNITVGGTGKTPAVVALAKHFRGKGCHPAVLSRGYGGKGKGAARVVSDGKAILAEVDEAGDEPLLIAQALEGVAVVTGRDRFKSGEYAIRNLGADILFLDDAFQHAALARDFDIVLLNAKAPCGNGFLIPRGPLREKAAALKRADAVVLSGADPKRAEAAFCLNRLREIRPGLLSSGRDIDRSC